MAPSKYFSTESQVKKTVFYFSGIRISRLSSLLLVFKTYSWYFYVKSK